MMARNVLWARGLWWACVLCSLFGFSMSVSARALDPALHRASRLLVENRIDEAQAALRTVEATHAQDAVFLFLRGDVEFQLGQYEDAKTTLRKVVSENRLTGAELGEARALLDLATATADATRGFAEQTSPSGHFVFRFRKGKDEVLIPHAGAALDKAWAALSADLADESDPDAATPKRPVRVEIYEEIADLSRVSTLSQKEIETSGTIALCKWNRLMIVSPKALLRGYPWLDTLTHEYTHYIVSRTGKGQVPLWFHEGLAKWMEKRWKGPPGGALSPAMEQLLVTAVAKKRLIPFSSMSPSLAKLPSQEDAALAFAQVYTFVEYLHAKAGFPGIRAFVKALSGGHSEGQALRLAYSASFDELDQNWRASLRNRRVRSKTALTLEKLHFLKRGNKAGAAEENETGDVADPKMRGFVRLGGLLRARGRLSAAAFEYEKAAKEASTPHPLVSLKLGRTYLEMGDADHAVAALLPATELYPDWAGLQAALGTAYLKKGEWKKAEAALDMAISQSPFDPSVHCGLKTVFEQNKSPMMSQASRACALLSSP